MPDNIPHPISYSSNNLFFDTIGAIKLNHAFGNGKHIYTYYKAYASSNGLYVKIYIFEENPSSDSAFIMFFSPENSCGNLIVKVKNNSAFYFSNMAVSKSDTLFDIALKDGYSCLDNADYSKSADEQGIFWSADLFISKDKLLKSNIHLTVGEIFKCAAFKYNEGNKTFFSTDSPAYDYEKFKSFQLVGY